MTWGTEIVGALVRIGSALVLACALGGCAAGPLPAPDASPSTSLDNLMELVPDGAQVLMGMGSTDLAQVDATALLGSYAGTRLTLMAVCTGSGTLHLELADGKVLSVPCNREVAMEEVAVAGPGRPDSVSIALEPGNAYSTLVYASAPGPGS